MTCACGSSDQVIITAIGSLGRLTPICRPCWERAVWATHNAYGGNMPEPTAESLDREWEREAARTAVYASTTLLDVIIGRSPIPVALHVL